MPRSFAVSYDRTTLVISACVLIAPGLIAVLIHNPLPLALAVALLVFCYAYSPRGYTVGERTIRVSRLAGEVTIPLESLVDARTTTKDDLRGVVRLWGNGGVFGYYGLFQMAKFGTTRWYVTNRKNSVVIETGQATALFSPDDVEGFLSAVRMEAPLVGRASGGVPVSTVRSAPAMRWAGIWIGVAIGVVVPTLMVFAFRYAPGPPECTLTRESLLIHDRFYPVMIGAHSVDVSAIRVIDFATDTEWRPTARTDGFANSHYRSGWFRVNNGQKVRLYCADGRRLVLIPDADAPVLIEAKDPEGFAEQLRNEWAR